MFSLGTYNGKLYAGQGVSAGDGDVLCFDGTTWSTSYNGAQEAIFSPCAYNGKLYVGQTGVAGAGDVYALQTLQTVTLDTPLANAHTNPVITVQSVYPVHSLATNLQWRVNCDQAGAAATTKIRVETEVLQ
jgi:outer membrane protein assembly factor BamB